MVARRIVWFLAATLAALPFSSPAQTFTWTNPAGGNYDSVLDWSPIGTPDVPGESARFNLPDTYIMSINTNNDTVSNLEVFDGDVTFVSANINKTYNVQGTTSVFGGDFTLARPGSGRIDVNTSSLTVSDEGTMEVLDTNVLTVNSFLRLGESNTFGVLKIMNQAELAMSGSTNLFIGDNTFDSDGVSRLEFSGPGTTGSGSSSFLIGNNSSGELFVRDGAAVTSFGTLLGMSGSSSRLLVDGGATFSISDPMGLIGSANMTSGTIEVLTGGRFDAGDFERTGGTTTVDGAGSILTALDFDIDGSAQFNVTGGGVIELDTVGSEFVSGGSDLTVTGAGSTIRGFAEIFLGDNANAGTTFTLSGGAAWEPSEPGAIFTLFASAAPDQTSAVTITGPGTTFNNANGRFSFSEGTNTRSTGVISNGAVATADSFTAGEGNGSEALLTIDSASLTIDNDSTIAGVLTNQGVSERGAAKLSLLPDGLLHTKGEVVLGAGATIELFGGEWRLRRFEDLAGTTPTVDWNNGKVFATNSTTLTPYAASILTPTGSLTFGQELAIEGTLTLQTTLSLDGGKLSLFGLSGGELLRLNSGVFEFVDDDLVIGPGGPLGEQFEMRQGLTLENAQDVIVTGLLIGRGVIDAGFGISSTGETRLGAGDRMSVTGFSGNSGRLELLGGRLDAEGGLTNNSTGDIVGRGTIDAGGAGLTNRGDLALSNGQSDVFGDVSNETTGRVLVSGGADVTFWDDVSHTGAAFNASAGSSVTFFGTAGFGVSGGGDVYMEADVTPGSSPGLETFGGNLFLGVLSVLEIELGGLLLGDEHDALQIAGDLSLGGALDVSLIDGFTPGFSQVFEILAVGGSLTGAFQGLGEGDLVGAFGGVDLFITYTSGDGNDIALFTAGLPGDYNGDGVVDAADYTVWRDGGAPDSSQAGYDLWAANYGATASSSASSSAAPEPSAAILLLLGLLNRITRRAECRRG